MVRRSIDLGEPILVVGLNYRLGVLGFLSSKELREEAHARGEVGYNNLGLHDQRVALQWVSSPIVVQNSANEFIDSKEHPLLWWRRLASYGSR